MEYVLTVIFEKKTDKFADIVNKYLGELSDYTIKGQDTLSAQHAVDIFFDIVEGQSVPVLSKIDDVDCFIQPVEHRRKKLLVADMDSTILVAETQDELAHYIGVEEQVKDITTRSMRGELQFKEAITETVSLLKDLPVQTIKDLLPKLKVTKGADVLVKTMTANGAICILASGGYTMVTSYVANKLGFDKDFGNDLEINQKTQSLTGKVIQPILDRDTKKTILLNNVTEYNLDIKNTMTIGDGANDIDMLCAASVGIAFHAKPKVIELTKHHINHNDLTAALYIQGYKEKDFVI